VTNAAGERMFSEPRTQEERNIRKYFAIKPLRESLESKDVYNDAANVREKEKRIDTLALRFRQAFVKGDQAGMDRLMQKYYDNGGAPDVLLSDEAIQNQILKSSQSQRERLSGRLNSSLRSLNRWKEMHDAN
jgi:hypothetical protein